jgi:hypothetical protein
MKFTKSNAIILISLILSAFLIDLAACNKSKSTYRNLEKYDIESNSLKDNIGKDSDGSNLENKIGNINENQLNLKPKNDHKSDQDSKDDDEEKKDSRENNESNKIEIEKMSKGRDSIKKVEQSKKTSKITNENVFKKTKTEKNNKNKNSLLKVESNNDESEGKENSENTPDDSENEIDKISKKENKRKILVKKDSIKNVEKSQKSKTEKNNKNKNSLLKVESNNDESEGKENSENTPDDSENDTEKIKKNENKRKILVKRDSIKNVEKSKKLSKITYKNVSSKTKNENNNKNKNSLLKIENNNDESESRENSENTPDDSENEIDKISKKENKRKNSEKMKKTKFYKKFNKNYTKSHKSKISHSHKKNIEDEREIKDSDEDKEDTDIETDKRSKNQGKLKKSQSNKNANKKIHKNPKSLKSNLTKIKKNIDDDSDNENSEDEKDENELHKKSKEFNKRKNLSKINKSKSNKNFYKKIGKSNKSLKKSQPKIKNIEDERDEKDSEEDVFENESPEEKNKNLHKSQKGKTQNADFKKLDKFKPSHKNNIGVKLTQSKQALNKRHIQNNNKSNKKREVNETNETNDTINPPQPKGNSVIQENQEITESHNENELYIDKIKKLLLHKKDCNKFEKSHYKIKIVRNPQFPDNPSLVEENTKYAKCQEKTGVLALVKENPEDDNTHDGEDMETQSDFNTIIATPIYLSLTQQNLSLFTNFNSNSLFQTIHLSDITRIIQPKKFIHTFCFEIISIKKLSAYAESSAKVLQSPLTLCGLSSSQMKEWVNAIQEFKQCHLNINQTSGDKILYDFEKVNELLNSPNVSDSERKLMNQLYYNNENSSFKNFYRQESERFISKELRSITDIIKSSNLQETKVKRELMNKLKSAEQFETEVKKKQMLIQDMIQRQVREANEKDTKLITIQHKAKEYELLKAVKMRIKQLKMQELKEYKTAILTKIKQTQMKADTEASFMMKMLMDHNKLTDFSNTCNNQRLFEFKDKGFVDGICLKYFGESGHPICIQKKQFCPMCCSHHVGSQHVEKLFECKSKCTKLINGIKVDLIGNERRGSYGKNLKGEKKINSDESNYEHEERDISHEDPEELSEAIKILQGEEKNHSFNFSE